MPAIFEIREWTEVKISAVMTKHTHHKAMYLFGFIPIFHYRLEK